MLERRTLYAVTLVLLLTLAVQFTPSFAQQIQEPTARKVVSKVAPLYPDIAKKMQLGGTVRLQVEIKPNGLIGISKVIGGHPMLAQAALAAVQKWRWAPSADTTTETIEISFTSQQ